MQRVINRLKIELEDLNKNPVDNCSAGPKGDDIMYWTGTIIGAEGTPYHNGVFYLDIKFSSEHPFKPPKITFTTPIYHPNISETGGICLDILKDKNWSAAYTVSKLLLSICSLLSDANPNDPLRADVAELYKNNRDLYNANAQMNTLKYANN